MVSGDSVAGRPLVQKLMMKISFQSPLPNSQFSERCEITGDSVTKGA